MVSAIVFIESAVFTRQVRELLTYRKGVKDDLSAAEKKVLRKLNEKW